ncbi:MAG: HIT domain-containing protein [Candidatus Pacebacteria bacterium]|nr:HIT domain-containing protein [Candidatus Paceibacterota bacterium]
MTEKDFSKNKIKDYNYWEVYVHENQSYLGRCVIWCKRENALDLTDATIEEQEELFIILKDLRQAIKKVFQTDWFNYSFLGNSVRHLHCHLVPRYQEEKVFNGITFKDELWGRNWREDHSFATSDILREQIKVKIQEVL